MLHRRVNGKDVELVYFSEFSHQACRCGHIAHFPTGHMVGFAKTGNNKSPSGQARVTRNAFVLGTIKHHVFIHFVTDHQDLGGREQGLQSQHIGCTPDRGAGVVRRVDHDGTGSGCQGRFDFFKIGAKASGLQRHPNHDPTGKRNVGNIAVVAGL